MLKKVNLNMAKGAKVIEYPGHDKEIYRDLRKIEQIRQIATTFEQGELRVEFKQYCAWKLIEGMKQISRS